MYFLVSMAAYGAIGAAMSQADPIATERRQGWARQLRVTPLPSLAYVAAKVASAVLLTVPALALVGAAGQVVNHVDLGVCRPGPRRSPSLALGSIPFAALGLLIGYLLDAESAQGGMVLSLLHAGDPRRPVRAARGLPGRRSLRLAACSRRPTSRTSAGPSWPGSSPTPSTSSSSPRGRSRSAALAAWRYRRRRAVGAGLTA